MDRTPSHAILQMALDEVPVRLAGRKLVRLQDAAGSTVRAIDGSVWITQEGDQRDIVLEAGESFTVDRTGAALVWPFDDAIVSVSRSPEGGGHVPR
jgi:hypothetical protein